MLQNVKPQPLAVYSAVTMKISLAVQTGAAKCFCNSFFFRFASTQLRPRCPASSSFVAEGQPARAFVPHPAPVPLHPRVGRHLHLHLLLLLLPVELQGPQRAAIRQERHHEAAAPTRSFRVKAYHWVSVARGVKM